jgi:predicted lipid-binding transport protein (Tim44 family)
MVSLPGILRVAISSEIRNRWMTSWSKGLLVGGIMGAISGGLLGGIIGGIFLGPMGALQGAAIGAAAFGVLQGVLGGIFGATRGLDKDPQEERVSARDARSETQLAYERGLEAGRQEISENYAHGIPSSARQNLEREREIPR